jgi:phosphatidate cytidylyltransferase
MSEANPILRMAEIVLAVLVVSSLTSAGLRRLKPRLNLAEVEARIKAWWIMAAAFFAAVVFNNTGSILFFLLISLFAFNEYRNLLHSRPADTKAVALAFLAIPLQYWWLHTGWYMMFVLFIPVYMFLVIPIWLVLSREAAGFVASAAALTWGLMAFGFGLSHLACLTLLPPASGSAADGRTMVLFLVFVVEISDVLQFVWGKTTGRHKLIPTISPNKTWEGLVGGVASAVVLSLALRFLTPFSVGETVLVSLLITLAGFFGGAVMSAVKRDFGVKDFGHLIPGHGGILDRVDSLVYAAPLFFHVVNYYHY